MKSETHEESQAAVGSGYKLCVGAEAAICEGCDGTGLSPRWTGVKYVNIPCQICGGSAAPTTLKTKSIETDIEKTADTSVEVPRLVRLSFWYFLRWLRGPVGIAQGMAQTISLGCWEPSWILKMEGWFLEYSWKVRDIIHAES